MSEQHLASRDRATQEVISINPDGTNGAALVYPYGATALASTSGNVANASAVGGLAGVAGKTTYVTGFEITGTGSTAALPVVVTLAGLVGGIAMNYIYTFAAGALVANQPLIVQFTTPLPAQSVNSGITLTCPAGGAGNTNNAVVIHGFQL